MGAAARKVEVGDLVIIVASYGLLEDSKIVNFRPKIVFLNSGNVVKEEL
jgi:aspartate 1-decarboxylase